MEKAAAFILILRRINMKNTNVILGQENINIRIESLKKLTDYVVLVRLHPLLNSKINKKLFDDSNFINVCEEEDIVNLYLITDILISDYSASIYEFALTGKKIVLYPYDYDEYKKYPGFCIDYKKTLPGPICYDENELYDTILNIEKIYPKYNEKWNNFNKKYNYMNDGEATKRFTQYLINGNLERSDKNE